MPLTLARSLLPLGAVLLLSSAGGAMALDLGVSVGGIDVGVSAGGDSGVGVGVLRLSRSRPA